MRAHLSWFGLILGLCLCLTPLRVDSQSPCTHYASPSGGGKGSAATSAMRIVDFWRVARPGTTLCLLDGHYTGAASVIQPPHGLAAPASHPITVRALHDGKAWLDGQGVREPVLLKHVRGLVVEGVNASNGTAGVVTAAHGSRDSIIRRVVAWDTDGSYFTHVTGCLHASNILFEDVVMFGRGRKMFARQHDHHCTLRRAFAMKNYQRPAGGTGPGGMAVTTTYNSVAPVTENVIAAEDLLPGSQDDGGVLVPDWYPDRNMRGQITVTAVGNLAYHLDTQQVGGAALLSRYSMNPGNIKQPALTVTTRWEDNVAIRRDAATPRIGMDFPTGRRGGGLSVSQGTYFTDSVGPLQGGQHTTNAGDKPLSAFRGGLLQCGATARPAFGAWLCHRSLNGQRTNQPLWPWPMKARLQAALVQSGYDRRGGLDGRGETDIDALICRLTGTCITGSPPPVTPPVAVVPAPTNLRAIALP